MEIIRKWNNKTKGRRRSCHQKGKCSETDPSFRLFYFSFFFFCSLNWLFELLGHFSLKLEESGQNSSKLLENCSKIALKLLENEIIRSCSENARMLHWNCTEIPSDSALKLHLSNSEVSLKAFGNYSQIALTIFTTKLQELKKKIALKLHWIGGIDLQSLWNGSKAEWNVKKSRVYLIGVAYRSRALLNISFLAQIRRLKPKHVPKR